MIVIVLVLLLVLFRGISLIPEIQDSLCRQLSGATYRGDRGLAMMWLSLGANPNRYVHGSSPAVHAAAAMNDTAMLKLLLFVGADPNLKSKFEATPLWEARAAGADGTAQILEKAGGYAYISPDAP
jgi:ankyrin repeat protein